MHLLFIIFGSVLIGWGTGRASFIDDLWNIVINLLGAMLCLIGGFLINY